MQKVFIIFAFLAIYTLAFTNSEELESLWSSWKIQNSKVYTEAEEASRFTIFKENYYKVAKFNAVNEDAKLALNKFADLTSTEFKSIYASGYVMKNNRVAARSEIDHSIIELPSSVDWRARSAVTEVKDQGQCGSCWAFATTGVLEGWYWINYGRLYSFSEQQIIDCDKKDDGCNGGDPVEALTYTADNGLELDYVYPYTAQDGGTCKFAKIVAFKTNKGSNLVTAKNTDALKTALVTQPVSVVIEADENVFQFYSSGVISSGCGDNLDHAVLVVGYTTVDNNEAFIVKNSWGKNWGDEGYVYVSTSDKENNGSGVCGILSQPVVPTI